MTQGQTLNNWRPQRTVQESCACRTTAAQLPQAKALTTTQQLGSGPSGLDAKNGQPMSHLQSSNAPGSTKSAETLCSLLCFGAMLATDRIPFRQLAHACRRPIMFCCNQWQIRHSICRCLELRLQMLLDNMRHLMVHVLHRSLQNNIPHPCIKHHHSLRRQQTRS